MLRSAKPDDFSDICALLSAARLSTEGVSENLDTFSVFELSGSVVGVGGIELRGSFALLRSLAVASEYQGQSVGSVVCDGLEAEAARRGVTHIYLLTETAEQFFSQRGYVPVPRADAPPAIASSDHFGLICPESAVLMGRAAQQNARADAETRWCL